MARQALLFLLFCVNLHHNKPRLHSLMNKERFMAIRIGNYFLCSSIFLKVVGQNAKNGEFKVSILMANRVVNGLHFSKEFLSNPGEFTKIAKKELIKYRNWIVRQLQHQLNYGLWNGKKPNRSSLLRQIKKIKKF